MPRYLVILAEPDLAFRDLLAKILEGLHCEVAECSSPPELGAELLCAREASIDQLLLVSSSLLASSCTDEIYLVSRARQEHGLRPLQILFTCELGDLERPLPDLGAGQLLRTLEKPFDISIFEDLVRGSLFPEAFALSYSSPRPKSSDTQGPHGREASSGQGDQSRDTPVSLG